MKKPSIIILVSSLLIGAIFTTILLSQMGWRTFANYNCQVPASTAKTEGCAIMEYGYPKRFVTSDVNVGEQNIVFATTSFNKTNLIFDWLVISTISFIVLCLLKNCKHIFAPSKKAPIAKR